MNRAPVLYRGASDFTTTSRKNRNVYIIYYPHMPIGKVWIYRLLLVFCSFVCTVTDFSGEDKASDVKFCTVVQGRPGQGIFNFGELCSS